MRIFKHYSPRTIFRDDFPSINFSRYTSRRRDKLNHLISLTSFIWFYWFLAFAIRIGPIPSFEFTNFFGFSVAQQSSGIRIPITQYHSQIKISKRHLLPISISRWGLINVDGSIVKLEELQEIIKKHIKMDPRVEGYLIVDKECKMQVVNIIVSTMRKNNYKRVNFFTSEHPIKM